MMQWWVCTMVCVLTTVSAVAGESVVVSTRYGALRGTRTTIGRDFYIDRFLKVPYGKPPLGALRFQAPKAADHWSGVRDATQYGPQCPQPQDPYVLRSQVFSRSEDCLFLNVYRPRVPDVSSRLPVMVWIHGGGYFMGTGNRFDWSRLAANGVVVVAINYRLGALGFLSTEDGASPGNYGLRDQIMALEWVRDVISDFNGDPTNVTIFGESAGGASVSLLVLSREAKGLFHRAIMESGVSLCPWALSYPRTRLGARGQALKLAKRLECDVADSAAMLQCLRNKNLTELEKAADELQREAGTSVFKPVAETTFGQYGLLVAVPEAVLRNGWFSHVPTLRGFNNDEDAISLPDDDDDGMTMEEIRAKVEWNRRTYLDHSSFPMDTDTAVARLMAAYFYTPNITDPLRRRQAFIQMETDFRFAAPTMHEVELAVGHNLQPQYVYRFSYRSANRQSPPWKGVQHVDELPYVVGAPVSDTQALPHYVTSWTRDDIRVSLDVMTMWTNFAKYGNPTPASLDGAKWLPWTRNEPRLLEIESSLRMVSDPVSPQQSMWIQVFSQMYSGTDSLIG